MAKEEQTTQGQFNRLMAQMEKMDLAVQGLTQGVQALKAEIRLRRRPTRTPTKWPSPWSYQSKQSGTPTTLEAEATLRIILDECSSVLRPQGGEESKGKGKIETPTNNETLNEIVTDDEEESRNDEPLVEPIELEEGEDKMEDVVQEELIIDGGSCTSVASEKLGPKLNLETTKHPQPYMLWTTEQPQHTGPIHWSYMKGQSQGPGRRSVRQHFLASCATMRQVWEAKPRKNS
jgi:hypothetical protein